MRHVGKALDVQIVMESILVIVATRSIKNTKTISYYFT